MRVLGVDPGFANFGWCIVDLTPNGIKPITCGVIVTEKSHKRLKVLAPDDEFRRTRELAAGVENLAVEYDVRMACAEGMSSPRNAVTVRMLGYAWGVIASVCERLVIPLAQVNPKQLKKKLCGRISVTDEELHREVFRRYPDYEAMVHCITVKARQEHAIDALGAVEACSDCEVFRTFLANLR